MKMTPQQAKSMKKKVLAMSCDMEIYENMQSARTVFDPAGCFCICCKTRHLETNGNPILSVAAVLESVCMDRRKGCFFVPIPRAPKTIKTHVFGTQKPGFWR